MKKFLVVAIVVVPALAAGAWFEPTHTVRGKLRGDPFFQDRSASWWEASLVSDDPQLTAHVPERLEAAKADAVPMLVHLLDSSRPEVRWHAADVLGKIGAPAMEAVPALRERLTDGDPFVRRSAVTALAAIKPDRPEVVSAIVKMLHGEDRDHVIRPLSLFRAAAFEAVGPLTEIAADASLPVKPRWEAVRTLGKIGPDSKPAVPLLLELLGHKENRLREHSAESLGEIGAPEAVGPLTGLLADKEFMVRRDAVRSLGQLGAAAKPSLPAIEKLLTDKEEIVREATKAALRRIDPQRK